MQPIEIPTRLDDPQQLLLWSADEIVPMILGLLFGMMIEKAFICFCAGYAVTHLYRRFRDNHADGFLIHIFYHFGFEFGTSKKLVNPYIKRFFP